MLSHHAPPRRLLQNFQRADRVGEQPRLWVYTKNRKPRPVYKVTAESAENNYFGGDPAGRSEEDIEGHLNDVYEGPFNRILPALCAELVTSFDAGLIKICSNYVANLFLRSKPRRVATNAHSRRFNEELYRRLQEPITLKRYAASVSFRTGQEVYLQDLLNASRNFLNDDAQSEEIFFESATTGYSELPRSLQKVHWSICRSPNVDLIQSDAAVALLYHSPDRTEETCFGYGALRPGSRWYLPVSPRMALRASPEYLGHGVIAAQEAEQINEYLLRAAYGSVYSSTLEPVIHKAVQEYLYSLRFFEHLVVSDVRREVDVLIAGLLR